MTIAGKVVVSINNAVFKSSLRKNAVPLFRSKIDDFRIFHGEKWVIWGPSKSTMLSILANKFLCEPPLSFSYGESLQPGSTHLHVEQLQFKGVIPTAHLSARYEFFKDEFDQTCKKYILDNSIGSNSVNYDVSTTNRTVRMDLYEYLIKKLNLTELQNRWTMGLSNGQMRRARLAQVLLKEPDFLLIDDPFLGLDPVAAETISMFLKDFDSDITDSKAKFMKYTSAVIGLRVQDPIPEWCTHICYVDMNGVQFQGPIGKFKGKIEEIKQEQATGMIAENSSMEIKNGVPIKQLLEEHIYNPKKLKDKQPLDIFELEDVSVQYKGESILSNIKWKVQSGSKWHLRGENGTGKSTILALIMAEHPQSWNSKIIDNGVPRKVGKSNYFDINAKIGISSPELHAIVLKEYGYKLSVKDCVSTGLHYGSPNNFKPNYQTLSHRDQERILNFLKYFNLYDKQDMKFNELSVSDQKFTLFVRSIVKLPELLLLDEAFSGMDTENIQICHTFLGKFWPGAAIVISHVPSETLRCNNYLQLVKPGEYYIGNVDESYNA